MVDTRVTLLNGQSVEITRVESVRLSDSLALNNVLFVPLFAFNLLSVSALTHTHNCCINFLSNSCSIQDLNRGLTIGKGRRERNLYFLDLGTPNCNSVFTCYVMSTSDVMALSPQTSFACKTSTYL